MKILDKKLMAKIKDAPKLVHTFTLSVELRKRGKRLAPAEIIARGKVTSIESVGDGGIGPWIVHGVVGKAFEMLPRKVFTENAFDTVALAGKRVVWGRAPKSRNSKK